MEKYEFNDQDILLVKALVGSRLGGWDSGDSDWDWRGVAMLPKEHYSNPFNAPVPDAQEISKSPDYVVYSAKHFFEKCAAGATNLVELLYSNQFEFENTLLWGAVKSSRELFRSKQWFGKFYGHSLGEWTRYEKTGDLKSAMNSFRLLSELYDLFENGKLSFPVYNSNDLKNIRCGVYSKGYLENWRTEKLYELRKLEEIVERFKHFPVGPAYFQLGQVYDTIYRHMYEENDDEVLE